MHPRVVEAIVSPATSAIWQSLWSIAPRKVRYFHQVDCPHSHQLLCLMPKLRDRYRVPVEVLVVPPPTPDQDPDPERARGFSARDAEEWARFYDVERPVGTPDAAAARAAQVRLLGLEGPERLDEAVATSRALWSGASLDAAGDPGPGLAKNQARLHRSGHYRGGTAFFEGEHYAGLARLTKLEAALGGGAPSGLEPRRAPEPAVERVAPGARLEWFYSFRSPYSYLSVGLVEDLVRRFDVEVAIRPVLPMVMRGLQVPFRKRLFLVRDAKREALARGLPFGRLADPVGVGVERLLAVFEVAAAKGEGLPFLAAAGRAVWAEGIDAASDGGLFEIAGRVGITPEQVRAALTEEGWRARVEANREALLELGLWGVPSFHLPAGDSGAGFCTWGQDRLFTLEARLPRR